MKATVKQWLAEGKVDVFLGYRMMAGHPLPYCFTLEKIEAVDDLVVGPAPLCLGKDRHPHGRGPPGGQGRHAGAGLQPPGGQRAVHLEPVEERKHPNHRHQLLSVRPQGTRGLLLPRARGHRRLEARNRHRQHPAARGDGALGPSGALRPLDGRISKVHQVLWVPQHLPGLFLQGVQPGAQGADRHRHPAARGAHFPPGTGRAHGRPFASTAGFARTPARWTSRCGCSTARSTRSSPKPSIMPPDRTSISPPFSIIGEKGVLTPRSLEADDVPN